MALHFRKHFSRPFVSGVVFSNTTLPHFKNPWLSFRNNATLSHLFSSFWPYIHSSHVIIFLFLPMSVVVEGVSSMELFSWLMVASAAACEASLSPFGNMVLLSIAIFDGSNLSRRPITSSKISTYGNLVRNHPRIHRNPRQFTWCSFNLNFNLTHSRYFRHNNLV